MTRNRFIVIITTSSTQTTHLYVFLEVIFDQQATTYIKNRNMIEHALQPRIKREKTDFVAVTLVETIMSAVWDLDTEPILRCK